MTGRRIDTMVGAMTNQTRQINVRIDKQLERQIADLQRLANDPLIPTAPELLRRALKEKHERDTGKTVGRTK